MVDLAARNLSIRILMWSGMGMVGVKQIGKQSVRLSSSRPTLYESQAGSPLVQSPRLAMFTDVCPVLPPR